VTLNCVPSTLTSAAPACTTKRRLGFGVIANSAVPERSVTSTVVGDAVPIKLHV
jgi:hypothetical protein